MKDHGFLIPKQNWLRVGWWVHQEQHPQWFARGFPKYEIKSTWSKSTGIPSSAFINSLQTFQQPSQSRKYDGRWTSRLHLARLDQHFQRREIINAFFNLIDILVFKDEMRMTSSGVLKFQLLRNKFCWRIYGWFLDWFSGVGDLEQLVVHWHLF